MNLVTGLFAFMMLFYLTGCGGSSTKTEDGKKVGLEDLKGKKITLLTSQGKFNEDYTKMADAMKEKYGCEVEFQVVPDNEISSLLRVKLATSEVPDVFEWNYPTQNLEIQADKYCEDLSDQPWVENLVNPELIKDPNDGKYYALPKESSSTYLAVYYNKDVMEKCGIKDPNPQTYQEFLDICQTIKEKGNGVTPFYMTNADTWTTQIFMTGGIPVALGDKSEEVMQALLTNKTKFTEQPVFVDILTKYVDLIKKGYVNKDHLSASYDTAAEKLGTGQAAMYLSVEQCVSNVLAKYPDTKLGSFVIPFGDNAVLPTGAYVQGLFVPNKGKQVEIAKQFLIAWSKPEIQNIYYKSRPGFSAFKDVDGGDVPEAVNSLVKNYIETGKYKYQLNDVMSEASTLYPELWNLYIEATTDEKTPEQVFETFQKMYADYMEQQGAEGF